MLILMPDSTSKVKAKWLGPGVVTERAAQFSYFVKLEDGSTRLLHANKLRLFCKRVVDVDSVTVLDDLDIEFGDLVEYPLLSDQSELEEEIAKLDLRHLSVEEANDLKGLIRKYPKVFSNIPGKCNPEILKHKIVLSEDFVPKKQRPYRLPEKLKPVIDKQIDDLLELGIIRESNSDICHPIVCVKKKTGDIRMCVDYRFINRYTKFDGYMLKRMDEIVHRVSNSTYLTLLDCTKGYYQIAMDEESIPLTSFVTHRGQFESIYMSFGLRCSSQSFQRAMDQILRPVSDHAEAYIDDICCHTCKTFQDHLDQLEKVLICIQSAGMTLKLSKCSFCRKEIEYLGFIVGQGKIVPKPSKVQALVDLEEPRTKKGVRSILAMFRFYCHLIPRFSEICIPLSDLTMKNTPNEVIFGEREKAAFQKLKQSLIDSTGIYSPDYSKKFIVTCDASEKAIAGCITDRG